MTNNLILILIYIQSLLLVALLIFLVFVEFGKCFYYSTPNLEDMVQNNKYNLYVSSHFSKLFALFSFFILQSIPQKTETCIVCAVFTLVLQEYLVHVIPFFGELLPPAGMECRAEE